MNTDIVDEGEFVSHFQKENVSKFYQWVSQYEDYIEPILRTKGYEYVKKSERTVSFTFGDVTFSRKCFKKGNEWIYPVDEKLGLAKYSRYSKRLLFQIAQLATMLPYRKVVQVIEIMDHVFITKDTVLKAIKVSEVLLKEKEDYRYYTKEKQPSEKIKAEIIYIEGDGVMVKSSEAKTENKNVDLTHFVVHTGTKKSYGRRHELQNKQEIIGINKSQARKKLYDCLYNQYDIQKGTMMVTNSDGGRGYTPQFFNELGKTFEVDRHEHFWDSYHLNLKIKESLINCPKELQDRMFQAIHTHNRKSLLTVLDTAESWIELEEDLDSFLRFKNRLMRYFRYTIPAELRGLSHAGIGIMESQHRKITYRMKKRGMYWSMKGADTMSRLIVLEKEGKLRELFFGQWRVKYAQYKVAEKVHHPSKARHSFPSAVANRMFILMAFGTVASSVNKGCFLFLILDTLRYS